MSEPTIVDVMKYKLKSATYTVYVVFCLSIAGIREEPSDGTTPTNNVPVGIVPAPHAPIAVAFSLGKGRVVVLGNSGALEARIFHAAGGGPPQAIGLIEADNQQFVLNVMHWLSRLLE